MVLLVAMVTIVLVSWWICRRMKRRKHLELKGAEAEIVRIDVMKVSYRRIGIDLVPSGVKGVANGRG